MAFTSFLQNDSPTGTRRALGATPAVGLAANTTPQAGYTPPDWAGNLAGFNYKPASIFAGIAGSERLFANSPFAQYGDAGITYGDATPTDWSSVIPEGYQVAENKNHNYLRQAMLDPSGQVVGSWEGPAYDSLRGSDYQLMAAMLTAGYGIAGAAGAGLGAGAAAAGAGELGSLGTAIGGDALGASLAGGMGEASALAGATGLTGGAGLGSAAGAVGAAGATSGAGAAAPTAAASGGWSNVANTIAKNPLPLALGVGALTGGGGGSAPTLDANAAATAQGQASKDASLFDTYLNRPDQVTPQGTLKWTLKPGADPKNPQPGDWVQTTALTETGQQLMDADQQLQLGLTGAGQSALGRVNDTLGKPLDTSGLAQMGQVSDFNGAERQRIEDALLARLNPGFAQDEEAMRSRTLNTGFELGSEGSQREQFRLDQAKNDARLAAIAQAGGEAERLSNISRSNAGFQNQSRQQGLEEILAQRALPLNELNSIRNGTQVQQPQFSPVSQSNTAAAPVMEALLAQLQGQQANAANKQSGYNALLASLAQLGGSYFGGP